MNKKQLYETIMRNVSREVKKALNESLSRVDFFDDIECGDDDYIYDVHFHITGEYQKEEKPTYDYPGYPASFEIDTVTFDENHYTPEECDKIRQYINTHMEELSDRAYDEYTWMMDDMRDAASEARAECIKDRKLTERLNNRKSAKKRLYESKIRQKNKKALNESISVEVDCLEDINYGNDCLYDVCLHVTAEYIKNSLDFYINKVEFDKDIYTPDECEAIQNYIDTHIDDITEHAEYEYCDNAAIDCDFDDPVFDYNE